MTAAFIGFLGVVAGALLTSWLNYGMERNRRRAEARVAAHLVSTELEKGSITLNSAVEADEWWSGEHSTQLWKANATTLAVEVPRELLEELAHAYSLLEIWDQRRSLAKSEKLDEGTVGRMKKNRAQIDGLVNRLKAAVHPSPLRRAARPLKLTMGAATIILACGLAYAAFVPRVELTDASIAAALEAELPEQATVDCRHSSGRWLCDATYPQARQSCSATQPHHQASARLAAARPGLVNGRCHRSPSVRRPESFEVGEGPAEPIATRSPEEIALRSHEAAIKLSPEETSYVTRAWEWLTEGE